MSPADDRRLREWLAQHPDHHRIFLEVARDWHNLGALKRYRDIVPLAANQSSRFDRRVFIGGAVAGVAALAIGDYLLVGGRSARAFETGVGQVRDVTLADGTRVALNAATRIEADIGAHSRAVRLVRGEALFSIAAKPDEMLSIATPTASFGAASGDILVKVLPTGVRVSVLTGGVHMDAQNSTGAALLTAAPGEEVTLQSNAPSLSRPDPPLLSRRTLWREGRLAFDNAPLSEAVADVARQTGARFVFADPTIGDLQVTGIIDALDLDGFLTMLRQNLHLEAIRGSDGVITLRMQDRRQR